MLEILLASAVAFIVSYLAIPVVIHIADVKKLYDAPDERKLHKHAIASLGGVGIFIGLVFACLLNLKLSLYPEFQYILAAAFVMFFIGLKDDIVILSATKKLIAQILVAAIIIHLAGLQLNNFQGIFGIYEIDDMFSIPFTYVTIILLINAYNLIDGIDGLAGSLGLLLTLVFGTYFTLSHMYGYAIFSFALSASLVAFLIFNYHPAKIFMGDSGSLLLGMITAVLIIKFINTAGDPASFFPLTSAIAIGISVIIIPLVDTLRVFTVRMLRGRSPFSPDRNHVHHLLIDRGLSHAAVTFICVAANIVLISSTYLLRHLGNTILIAGLFVISFSILGLLYITLPRRKMVTHRRFIMNRAKEQGLRKAPKVISLTTKEPLHVEQM